jgi:hypothetical protein
MIDQLNFHQILKETETLAPEDGAPIFKFASVGDHVVAKFVGRRRDVKTKQGTAIALDVEILASTVVGDKSVTGPHSVFESGHITQLLDRANLATGDVFVLRLDSVDRKSRFKKFAFKKVIDTNGSDGEPPDDVPDEENPFA